MLPWLNHAYQSLVMRACADSLHHGLLMLGPQGIGKTEFSNHLAQLLLCKKPDVTGSGLGCGQCQSCHLFTAHSHPDMYVIASDKQIGVDLVRYAIEKLQGTAQLSGRKVLIIEQADSMTESAANALLKTLEEPTDNTFLMLISDKPERLLPTILSRCEKVNLPVPNYQQCIEWLKQQGHDDFDDALIQVYNRRPFKIKAELEKDSGVTHTQFVEGLAVLKNDESQAIKLAEKWQTDADQVILWLQHLLRSVAHAQINSQPFWNLNQALTQSVIDFQNPGLNRVLVLAGLLRAYRQLPNT
jgi:DNA polymerase-3 subunit delta'